MRRWPAILAALGLCAAAAPAQAGVYTVYACSAAGQQWDNRSRALGSPVGRDLRPPGLRR